MTDNRFCMVMVAAIALVGCGKEEAPPVVEKPEVAQPEVASTDVAKPQTHDLGATEGRPAVEEAVKPTPTSPIEDPPVIGTPQEAFNFPRRPLEMPPVLLTVGEESISSLRVGDTMPDLTLPDFEGKTHSLSKLRGDKLTVVVFWNSTHPYAVEEISDLGPAVVDRFGDFGVRVVGIAERDTPAGAKAAIAKAGAKFVNLADADGKEMAKVATAELPRTYLLDPNGKVLWFDLEYSRSTRRDLVRAIQFALLNDK